MRADARRNRERVLAAAEAVFAADGAAAPLDEVARRAGVGPGTVYRHFPNKESLFTAIVASRLGRLLAQAHSLSESDDPGAAFFGFLALWVEEGLARRDVVDALSAGTPDRESAAGTIGNDFYKVVGLLLKRAQQAGAVRQDVTIADVKALLIGVSLAVRQGGDLEAARRLVGIVGDGLESRS